MPDLVLADYRAATSWYLDELDEQISSPGSASSFGWPRPAPSKLWGTARREPEDAGGSSAHERRITIGKGIRERPTIQFGGMSRLEYTREKPRPVAEFLFRQPYYDYSGRERRQPRTIACTAARVSTSSTATGQREMV